MSLIPTSPDSPVIKIGAVVVRASDRAVLIVQPKAKNKGEHAPLVLPRGSRQYSTTDSEGHVVWHDARDMDTAEKHRNTLEPYERALKRELREEAGLSTHALRHAKTLGNVRDLGVMDFDSNKKGTYKVQWFTVMLGEREAKKLTEQPLPVDAVEVRWARLPEIKKMAQHGEFSKGYIPVIEAALAKVPPHWRLAGRADGERSL